jgi:hypothetical protein
MLRKFGYRRLVRAAMSVILGVISLTIPAQTHGTPNTPKEARYPPIGKAASVQGDVVLDIKVGSDGHVSDTSVVSGPMMLRGAAVDYVKTWEYPAGEAFATRIAIRYRLAEPADGYNDESQQTRTNSEADSQGVTVTAIKWVYATKSECPQSGDAEPPASLGANDYVELFRSGCMGSCPAYTVRVTVNGTVSWNPDSEKPIEAKIAPEDARQLLEAFRTPRFWAACKRYEKFQTDSASYGLEVQVNGRVKQVGEYADAAPEFIHDLELRVDEAADTHHWRVGDPKDETMADIGDDVWLPKPGRTKLMSVVVEGKPEEMAAALAKGDKITDLDSSGWIPLMYAASSYYSSDGVKFLLSKGADPNTRGPKGETALMFSALTGSIDEDLLAAGADVNAATNEGVTALMLLTQRGEADEISTLLKAGADAKAKDSKGRTALDYLLAASCGNRIVDERVHWGMMIGYGACTAIDADDLKASRLVLESAGARQTRVWYPKSE